MYATHYSPRFGAIGCLKAIRAIGRGDEIIANYNYPLDGTGPTWYRELYKVFQSGRQDLAYAA
jgi:hypothetical protein